MNPYVILGGVVGWIASVALAGWLMYARGHDDMRNAFTEQQLAQANTNLKNTQVNQNKAATVGVEHEAKVQVVHDTTRTIIQSVNLPPESDPFLPVGFVRVLDRSASRAINGDPYPGKSDGDPSDARVSEAQALLAKWADDFYVCRQQVADTIRLKPVLPSPPVEGKGLLERLGL